MVNMEVALCIYDVVLRSRNDIVDWIFCIFLGVAVSSKEKDDPIALKCHYKLKDKLSSTKLHVKLLESDESFTCFYYGIARISTPL